MSIATTTIEGTYHAGHVDLDKQVDWPEGCRVRVALEHAATPEYGMREEDWPDTPENREKILARMDAVEPLELSEEDEARITAVRTEMKAKSIEAMRQLMGLQP